MSGRVNCLLKYFIETLFAERLHLLLYLSRGAKRATRPRFHGTFPGVIVVYRDYGGKVLFAQKEDFCVFGIFG